MREGRAPSTPHSPRHGVWSPSGERCIGHSATPPATTPACGVPRNDAPMRDAPTAATRVGERPQLGRVLRELRMSALVEHIVPINRGANNIKHVVNK